MLLYKDFISYFLGIRVWDYRVCGWVLSSTELATCIHCCNTREESRAHRRHQTMST